MDRLVGMAPPRDLTASGAAAEDAGRAGGDAGQVGARIARREVAGLERAAPGEVRVRRALLSVSDKHGIVDFASGLAQLGVEIVSTGGTARELAAAGIAARPIEDFTGFPEIMDG